MAFTEVSERETSIPKLATTYRPLSPIWPPEDCECGGDQGG
jgi:hypothetical protein